MYNKAAKALGLPVSEVRSAMYYIEKRSRYRKHPDGRFLMVQESRNKKRIHNLFKKQMKWLVAEMRNLSVFNEKYVRLITKDLNDEINELNEEMPYWDEIVSILLSAAGLSMLRGASREGKRHPIIKPYAIDLQHEGAISYLQQLRTLHLSQAKGSIMEHTQRQIAQIIAEGLNEGMTYTQMAKLIQQQGVAGVFSQARAQRIAVDQLTKAYSYGKELQVNDFIRRTGARMSKLWSTVGDEKVSEDICRPNEAQGWLPWKALFQSGDSNTPGHINCRCDLITRIDSV